MRFLGSSFKGVLQIHLHEFPYVTLRLVYEDNIGIFDENWKICVCLQTQIEHLSKLKCSMYVSLHLGKESLHYKEFCIIFSDKS